MMAAETSSRTLRVEVQAEETTLGVARIALTVEAWLLKLLVELGQHGALR
jgi:hypothetical protein